MKELNTPVLTRFFEHIVNENKINHFTSTELFNKFNEFVKSNNFKVEYTSTKFGIEIKSYEGVEKKRSKNGMIIDVDIDKLKSYLISLLDQILKQIHQLSCKIFHHLDC